MKVKTIVEMNYHNVYCGWNSTDYTDVDGNVFTLKHNDDQTLEIADVWNRKAERIRKERAELAAEQQRALEAQENENE